MRLISYPILVRKWNFPADWTHDRNMTVRNAYTRDIRAPTHHHLEWNIRSEFIETSTTEIHKPFQAGISNILLVSPLSCRVRRNPDCIFLSGRVYIYQISFFSIWSYSHFQKLSSTLDGTTRCSKNLPHSKILIPIASLPYNGCQEKHPPPHTTTASDNSVRMMHPCSGMKGFTKAFGCIELNNTIIHRRIGSRKDY